MKRLAFVLATAALVLLPGGAQAAACSPLDCAPSQFALADGTLVAYRATALGTVHVADLASGQKLFAVPGGFVGGNVIVHKAANRLEWFDLRTGKLLRSTTLPWPMSFAGVSIDGSRAVGFRHPNGSPTVVIGGASRSSWRQVPLPKGNWGFDALRGNNLFLIKYLRAGGYEVQFVDLSTDSPTTRLLKDPRESGTIWGSPFSRLASSDGKLLFTLYIGSNGAAMVHELNLAHPSARCIDLPGTGYYNWAISWAMGLSADGKTLWAVSPGYGRVVAIDVATRVVETAFRIDLPYWDVGNATMLAVRADGRELALSNGEEVARLSLDDHKLLARTKVVATALGYSPNGELRTLR